MSEPRESLVIAEGLGLRTKNGVVFDDLQLDWPAGRLVAVTGPAGSCRSSLLLAVTGRMRGLTGRLRVAGLDAVAESGKVRALTSVARISDLAQLEGRLTVSESIVERALIDAVHPDDAMRTVAELEDRLDLALPRAQLVDDLPALEQTAFAAILATVRPSRLVVLDDADARIDLTDQRRLYEVLRLLAEGGPTVAVSVTETAALPADVPRVELSRPAPDSTDTKD
jgi:ABC-type multidrug transport system ATPase subunit